jgi:lipid-A-disaccharide synthase
MRIFVSAGEPSGDMHGANLIHALRRLHPGVEVVGLGGERMAAAGCRLLYPLAEVAVMGVRAVLARLPTFFRVLGQAREEFRRNRPDVVVPIDCPGFHWWLAGAAKKQDIPVSYFVPPQLWAWASWRVRRMRRLTDQVLSSLPFEHDWFVRHGVTSHYVGHPYFDELQTQRLDEDFLRASSRHRQGPTIALLPGSRGSEMRHSRETLARAAALIHAQRPDVHFLVACLKASHAEELRPYFASLNLPLEVYHGKTPEIIHLAHACLSVSGSVSLELLHREKPSVMFYHVHPVTLGLARRLFRLNSITLVNLLAKGELFPEYVASSTGRQVLGRQGATTEKLPNLLAAHALHWLDDRSAYETLCDRLRDLKHQVAQPGACERAATAILKLAHGRSHKAARRSA